MGLNTPGNGPDCTALRETALPRRDDCSGNAIEWRLVVNIVGVVAVMAVDGICCECRAPGDIGGVGDGGIVKEKRKKKKRGK